MADPNNADDVEAFLSGLTPAERAEAVAAAAAAKRAEERAEQRALESAMRERQEERRLQKQREDEEKARGNNTNGSGNNNITLLLSGDNNPASQDRIVFIPKRKREQLQKEATEKSDGHDFVSANGSKAGPVASLPSGSRASDTPSETPLSEKERMAVMETYLGKSATEQEGDQIQKRKKVKTNKKITFKFRWDETDDTSNFNDNEDPLYAPLVPAVASRNINSSSSSRRVPPVAVNKQNQKLQKMIGGEVSSMVTVMKKPLDKMTARDWRIFRENFEITVKGGQAPPPMRSFTESPAPYLPQLHPALLDAIHNVLRFKEPSPIQRQAIPIGLQRRDLIGISETGSGKTVAFGVPMCHYLLNLPATVLGSVSDQGPLALVMAPTRELALQIDVELQKLLSRQQSIKSCAVVGGQPIQQQAQQIRSGVHIIVGTPGRINDCVEMAYLVLNQCCYIVMDEADRMIDMGFAPQMESM